MNEKFQQLGGIAGGFGSQGIYMQPSSVTIPLSPENWKKLSRATQLAVLSELGIIAAPVETKLEFKPYGT